MSKFRARQLDASKPIPVYMQEDIPDFAEFNAINRTVPQMPTGMEKEEETEHHLQQAIFHQRVIPVPEVYEWGAEDPSVLDRMYPPNYKAPRQHIHIHPFSADQDIPEYDMDSEDEEWLNQHAAKGEVPLTNLQFEEMMDRLEKASGLKAVTLQEAKVLLKDDDDLIIAVYDYWLNKRLRLTHALIPQVKTEKGSGSNSSDPYVAFRKRTEKMQTRKNRKNDESSYEKMLKLRRDLSRAVLLLDMVKRREKAKREYLNLNIEVFERRYEVQDFSGSLLAEVSTTRTQRPAFAPLFSNHQLSSGTASASATSSGSWVKVAPISHSSKEDGKRDRRAYKKRPRRHHTQISSSASSTPPTPQLTPTYNHPPDPYTIAATYPQDPLGYAPPSSEDEVASPSQSEAEEENEPDGVFTFRRKKYTNYHAPREGNWPWVSPDEGGGGDPRFRFSLTSLSYPTRRCVGFARRRRGRGGRMWLDRISSPLDDLWFKTDFRDVGPNGLTTTSDFLHEVKTEWPHFCPRSPPEDNDTDVEIDVETVGVPVTLTPDVSLNSASSPEELNLTAALPSSVFISAEILEGDATGNITELEVSIPSELDTLLNSDSGVLLEENLEVDLVTENSNGTRSGGGSGGGGGANDGSNPSGGVTLDDLSNSEWASNFSSTSDRLQQHSVDFTTQPTSKFVTLDSTNTLPLAVSGLQLSTSNVTGDEIHSSTFPSSSSSSSATSSSLTSTSSSSSTSLPTSSATSLSNSLLCASSNAISDKVGSECSNSDGSKVKTSAHQESSSADALNVSSGLLLSNNKNNGSNIISSATTNNLVSQKFFASSTRTNDSLPNSESNSSATVLTNGPSNSFDGSKCAKVDHYMFHET